MIKFREKVTMNRSVPLQFVWFLVTFVITRCELGYCTTGLLFKLLLFLHRSNPSYQFKTILNFVKSSKYKELPRHAESLAKILLDLDPSAKSL